ncbi:MAG: coenzyme F420-0:L-glutamate ligase [Bacillota bacterium]|jgi:coenzyme F420-0:L-glutamate ligase
MRIQAIRTPVIEIGSDLLEVFRSSYPGNLAERSVVCVTSKVVSLEQRRVEKLSEVVLSEEARALSPLKYSKNFERNPGLAELILRESDRIYKGHFVYLTLKDGTFIPNAGIDLSNVPDGYAVLWPRDPVGWARQFREKLKSAYGLNEVGVLMTDSRCTPLRRGVIGLAVAYSGFEGVDSQVGKKDLFGRELEFTEKAVADCLASAAVLVMGESGESTPFAVVEDAPVTFTDSEVRPGELNIDPRIDLFAGLYDSQIFDAFSKGKKHERAGYAAGPQSAEDRDDR